MTIDLESLRAALAVLAKHRDSHMSMAMADGYSAQEYPKLRDAHIAVDAAITELTARRARDAVEALVDADDQLQRPRLRTLAQVRDEHEPKYRRKRLGQHPVNGRTLWGCELECSCGFSVKWNEGKRETEREWRVHTRHVWATEEAALAPFTGANP